MANTAGVHGCTVAGIRPCCAPLHIRVLLPRDGSGLLLRLVTAYNTRLAPSHVYSKGLPRPGAVARTECRWRCRLDRFLLRHAPHHLRSAGRKGGELCKRNGSKEEDGLLARGVVDGAQQRKARPTRWSSALKASKYAWYCASTSSVRFRLEVCRGEVVE